MLCIERKPVLHDSTGTCNGVWRELWVLHESSSAQKCMTFLSGFSLHHQPMNSQSITSEWPQEGGKVELSPLGALPVSGLLYKCPPEEHGLHYMTGFVVWKARRKGTLVSPWQDSCLSSRASSPLHLFPWLVDTPPQPLIWLTLSTPTQEALPTSAWGR